MEKNDIKISIIFPTYNGENVLQANLTSIQNLSNLDEIELIIIDNNSTDSTKEVIKSCKDINLRLIEQSRNLGFAEACNIGVLNAKGEFIFITNQDVIFPSKFFQKLKKVYLDYKKKNEFIISPAVIFKGGTIHYFGAKIHFLGFSFTPEIGKKLPKRQVIKNTQRISGCALFMKKDLFIEIGGFDNNLFMYCEDTDFAMRYYATQR